MDKFPIVEVKCINGLNIMGMLFQNTMNEIILIDKVSSQADLGPYKNKVTQQINPEATIKVIPKSLITELKSFK